MSARKPTAKAKADDIPAPKREPTARERRAIEAAKAAQAARPARAEVVLDAVKDNTVKLSLPHTDRGGAQALIYEALGTASHGFADNSLMALINSVTPKAADLGQQHYDAGLALMGAIAPANELETAIGLQIVATHYAALDMTQRARLNAGEYVNSAAAYTNMAAKFSRTMAAHLEALAKLRNGGTQTHEVRYVYVNGPAAFGPGATAAAYGGGGGGAGNLDQSHAPLAIGSDGGEACPPMWSQDPERYALSGAGGDGSETLQDARRRQPRRAAR